MINIKDEGIVLEKTDLAFENKAVLNPTCIQIGDITHMYYRAVSSENVSSIGYCRLKDNKVIERFDKPVLFPEFDYEVKGVEDPRVTYLDGIYYLFYTAYDGKDALIAYATSKDLVHFVKEGVISPRISYDKAEDIFRETGIEKRYTMYERVYREKEGEDVLLFEKDASLFPRKINGKFALLHRVLPGIQIIYFDKFSDLTDENWRDYFKNFGKFIVLDPLYGFESLKIGGGVPPIETEEGWLIIYHSVEDTPEGEVYHAAAALLDRDNPLKVLGRLKEPLFSPKETWEKNGVVNQVVFPTGTVIKEGRLYIYYGAADTRIGAKSLLLRDLLDELINNSQA